MEKSRMVKSLQRSRERKQNNKGSSLVLVMAVMAIVGIFAVALISVSLMNYRMKNVNLQSQDNFYDAEKVLDEIRTGLAVDVAQAAGEAYQETMTQFSALTVEERQAFYARTFGEKMKEISSLVDPVIDTKWNPTYLNSLVSQETKAGTKDGTGLKIESADGLYFLNRDEAAGSFTIKKLKITYVDKNDYMTEIQTDIDITCPDIDYTQVTSVPELTSYCIVAQNQTKTGNELGLSAGVNSVNIVGNAYLGNNGAIFDTSSITFTPNGTNSYIVTAGEMNASNGSSITVNSGVEVWGRELYLDSSVWSSNCKLYLNDDLTLSNSSATLSGEVYAYGNPDNVRASGVYVDNKTVLNSTGETAVTFQEDVANNPENYSSAFLINGKNVSLNLSGITQMQIAGNAYVATKSKGTDANKNDYDVMMGESVALKSDQRAYLVPSEYMASACTLGGVNPMDSKSFLGEAGTQGLLQEIAEYHGITTDMILADPTWLIRDESGKIVETLDNLGVVGVRQAYYPVSIGGTDVTMVYFFLVFDNAASAKNYADSYFTERADEVKVRIDSQHYKTTVQYPAGVTSTSDYSYYYNGSILYADSKSQNGGFLSGRCQEDTGKTPTQLALEQRKYQEKYAALCHMLKVDYTELSSKQKGQSVYANLVNKEYMRTNANAVPDIFTNADTGDKAIVVNGNYTIDASTDTDVHVVIASGTVYVSRSFSGLILTGGDLVLTQSAITIQSDSASVEKALAGTNAGGIVRAVDYLYGGEQYLSPEDRTTAGGDTDNSAVNYLNSVTYSNWKKQ